MLIAICKSKIHRVKVTDANLNYEGSITIDQKLLKKADIVPNELVQVVNINNGARFETYVMPGKENSGVICLNGPAARLGEVGDVLIIISYSWMEKDKANRFKPKVIYVDKNNKPKKR